MTAIDNLESVAERIRQAFDAKNAARDQALSRSRELIRHCALSIRATHREEFDTASELLEQAHAMADLIKTDLRDQADLYYAGYTQDALKEYAEANITYALVRGHDLPEPESLGIEYAAYLNGLAEAVGELRRHAVDRIRLGQLERGQDLLKMMDDIYDIMVTMDYPDAITSGLRRSTDLVRGVTERTRGDLTVAVRQDKLEKALAQFQRRIGASEHEIEG